MKLSQAVKKAANFVAKELSGKVCWVWEKRTLFLPSVLAWRKKWWGRPIAVFVTAISVVAFLGLAAPTSATIGSEYVWPAFAWLLEAISALIGQLLLWAIDLLIQVSKYNSFLDANVVSIGWVLVRDVANMFFILIMLVIAFGTMLKIEAYSWKKLLPRLILTALLVNFSKTFIGLLIDFSQVVMLTFVNGYAAAAGGNFMSMFQIKNLFASSQNADVAKEITFQVLMGFALGTIMLGISLIVILVFVAILIFRIITLWILIVLSPLAFLLGTFPKGQEYYGQWWKQLQGQIIVGPMVAFFLWLSLAALGGGENNAQIKYSSAGSQDLTNFAASKPTLDTGTEVGNWDNLASFAVSIAMLLLSLQMIQQLGVAGAGLASGALSMIKSKATAAAKKLAVPVALGVATGGVGTGLMAWGGLGVGKFAGGKVKEGVKEWYDIKKQEIKTKILGRAKEGKFTLGLGAYSMYKMKMRQRKELAEEKEKHMVEPLVGRMKDEARARAAGLTEAQIKSGARVSNEEVMILAEQDKKHEARISQGITTAAQYAERSQALQAAYKEAEKKGDTSTQSNIRQALLDLIGSSVEGHSVDDAMGGDAKYKTVEGKVQMLKDIGILDDSKLGARLERIFQNMNKSTSVDYKNFDEISSNKDKTPADIAKIIRDKQSFAANNLTAAQIMGQHADTLTHGEFKEDFINRIMTADARSLANLDRRHASATALGINNIALSPEGKAWDKKRQNDAIPGSVLRIPPDQFQLMLAAMKDPNKREAMEKILRQLGIEDKAKTKIVQSTWNKDTETWDDDMSTETTLGEKFSKYRPEREKSPMGQVKEMANGAPSRREEAEFRDKDSDTLGNPLPDIDALAPAARAMAQETREAAVTFGATIQKAGNALKQRLSALQASDPSNAAIQPLVTRLDTLLAVNRRGLLLDADGQKKMAERLALLGKETKEIEPSA